MIWKGSLRIVTSGKVRIVEKEGCREGCGKRDERIKTRHTDTNL